jgi:hypothetical protein
MEKQKYFFTLTLLTSIVFGIILPLALGVRGFTPIAIFFTFVWFIYVVGLRKGRILYFYGCTPFCVQIPYSNISSANCPSAIRVTGPTITMSKFSSTEMLISPPGIWTAIFESHRPSFRATAAAALLLLPEANV